MPTCQRLLLPLLLLLVVVALSITTTLLNNNHVTISESSNSNSAGDDDNNYDEAEYIINRSFQQTYAHMLPCDDISSWMKARETSSIARKCMERSRDYIINSSDNNHNITVPWWFRTLLRDITAKGAYGGGGGGVFGPWHHFDTTDPPLNFCTMDKVGTSSWRSAFCKLNAKDCINNTKGSCGKRKCTWYTLQTMPQDAPWAVFVRDPLERLLSGYLDKCYDSKNRRMQGHCQPEVVFNPKEYLHDAKDRPYHNLLDSIDENDKIMFEAYVDVLPLKWNAHFVPQALHCDLYRNIDKYHFVGTMGPDFYFDLERMANQFGGQLPEILNTTFEYMDHVKRDNHYNTGKQDSKHSMHASEKVMRFYTARTVAKALEYLSIDYVTLDLEVPEWAKQMLRNDAWNS